MNLEPRDKQILEHIIEYCNQILETVQRFGDDYDKYQADFVYRNATALCILQIGELVGNLTDAFKSIHTDITWRQIKAVRNIIAHHYGSIDAEVTWDIITDDIPNLKTYCQQQIDNNSGGKNE